MAEKYIPKLRIKQYKWYINCFLQLLLLYFGCLASETSDSLLVFALYICNPQLTNGKVSIVDEVIGSISGALSCPVYVSTLAANHVYNAISQLNSSGARGRRK